MQSKSFTQNVYKNEEEEEKKRIKQQRIRNRYLI